MSRRCWLRQKEARRIARHGLSEAHHSYDEDNDGRLSEVELEAAAAAAPG